MTVRDLKNLCDLSGYDIIYAMRHTNLLSSTSIGGSDVGIDIRIEVFLRNGCGDKMTEGHNKREGGERTNCKVFSFLGVEKK